MPFVTKHYYLKEPIAAFLFLMRERGYSLKAAQRAIDKAYLRQNGRKVVKNEILSGAVQLDEFQATDINLAPLYANEDFCVYDKPHNLLSHPKGRFYHYSLNDALKSRFGNTASILHRLDKQTSGLLLCSINPKTQKELKKLMEQRAVSKIYRAIIQGRLKEEILIDEPISTQMRKGGDLCIKSIICKNGKPSRTLVRPIAYDTTSDSTLVEAIPLTGRTHQIRLHCAFIGHRILGDPLYGVKEEYSRIYLENPQLSQYTQYFGAPYLCLNAYQLNFSFKANFYSFKSSFSFHCAPHFSSYFHTSATMPPLTLQIWRS